MDKIEIALRDAAVAINELEEVIREYGRRVNLLTLRLEQLEHDVGFKSWQPPYEEGDKEC